MVDPIGVVNKALENKLLKRTELANIFDEFAAAKHGNRKERTIYSKALEWLEKAGSKDGEFKLYYQKLHDALLILEDGDKTNDTPGAFLRKYIVDLKGPYCAA